ncbi:Cardiolipin synthase (CMP-forming) [Manis javanica]|nr:Cardiolipin synthase (CMP-forming) [Manis javanica]
MDEERWIQADTELFQHCEHFSKYFNPCYATARLKPTFISKKAEPGKAPFPCGPPSGARCRRIKNKLRKDLHTSGHKNV